jgi:hypothetical protein
VLPDFLWFFKSKGQFTHIMPFPCHAVLLKVHTVSFPLDLHSAAVFDSHMPWRTRAMPRLCWTEIDFSRPCHSAAWAWHDMCELASVVQRGMWSTCGGSASSGYHTEFHEGCYQKHTSQLNCRTSSSDISGYHADFHEGPSTVRKWQGAAWYVWIKAAWHGRSVGATWHVWISLNAYSN